MPYPPGVHSGTRGAPWNEPPAPECPECQETIVDIEDHTEWCEWKATQEQIYEYHAEPTIIEEY